MILAAWYGDGVPEGQCKRWTRPFLGMQKLQEISQAFNRPQPTHREPSQERPQNHDALGAKLYAWKKKATQVPQGDEYEHHYAEDPYEVSEEHTVKIGDGEDDMKVPGGILIGYWRDNTWRWPNLARVRVNTSWLAPQVWCCNFADAALSRRGTIFLR